MKIVRLPKECFIEMLKEAGFGSISEDLIERKFAINQAMDRERTVAILAKFGALKVERLQKEGIVFDGERVRQPFDAYQDPATGDYVFLQGPQPEIPT
jgi:hypothetical protein